MKISPKGRGSVMEVYIVMVEVESGWGVGGVKATRGEAETLYSRLAEGMDEEHLDILQWLVGDEVEEVVRPCARRRSAV